MAEFRATGHQGASEGRKTLPVVIPLASAFLCECGLICNNPHKCACGNELGLLSLANVLNRPSERTPDQQFAPSGPCSPPNKAEFA